MYIFLPRKNYFWTTCVALGDKSRTLLFSRLLIMLITSNFSNQVLSYWIPFVLNLLSVLCLPLHRRPSYPKNQTCNQVFPVLVYS